MEPHCGRFVVARSKARITLSDAAAVTAAAASGAASSAAAAAPSKGLLHMCAAMSSLLRGKAPCPRTVASLLKTTKTVGHFWQTILLHQQRRTYVATSCSAVASRVAHATSPTVTVLPSVSLPSSCSTLVATLPLLPSAALPAAARRLVKEGVHEAQAWRTLSQRVVAVAQELNIQQAALLLNVSHDYCEVLQLRHEQATGESGGNSSSGCGNGSVKESQRYFRMLKQSRQPHATSSSLTARDWTNIVVSSGRLLYLDRELHELLTQHLHRLLPDMRPKDLVNIAHAYARLRVIDKELFHVVATTLPDYLYDLTAVGLTNIITSFARAEVYDANLFDAVTAEAARRIQEFGGTELLNLLMGLSKTHTSVPPEMKRRDTAFVATVIKALRRRMGPFGFVQLLQMLEYLILLDYFDPLFIHKKLLPALLARRPSPPTAEAADRHAKQGPGAAAATAARAETLLTLYLRLLCCLQQLPALSQTALQLLQEVVEQFPLLFMKEDLGRVAAAIHLLHRLQVPYIVRNRHSYYVRPYRQDADVRKLEITVLGCYDYDAFSKAETLLLHDRVATLRQLRFANVVQLLEAFKAFGDDAHWEELLSFFKSLTEETKVLLLKEQDHESDPPSSLSPSLTFSSAAMHEAPRLSADSDACADVGAKVIGKCTDTATSTDERVPGITELADDDAKENASHLKIERGPDGQAARRISNTILLCKNEKTGLKTSGGLDKRVSLSPKVLVHRYADGGYHSSVVTLDKHTRKQVGV